MKKQFVFAFTIFILFPYLCYSEELPSAEKRPDFRVGDAWELTINYPVKCHRLEGHGEVDGELLGQCGDIYMHATIEDGNWTKFTNKDGEVLAEFKPYIPSFDYPMSLGKTWQGKYSGYVKGETYPRWDSTFKAKVVAYEEVSVEHGAFMAYRIDWEDRWSIGNANGVNKGSTWVSPELKYPLKNENYGDSRWSYELKNVQTQ